MAPLANRSLIFVRTRSLRHMRHLGSRWNPSPPGANSVEFTDSSTTPLAVSDTDIAISPRSTERTRTVVGGFILPERDLLCDKEETSSAGQRRVTSTPR